MGPSIMHLMLDILFCMHSTSPLFCSKKSKINIRYKKFGGLVLTGRAETREILQWLLDCIAYLEGLDIDTLLLPIHELGLSVWRRVMKLKGIHILEVPPYFLISAMSIFAVILVINHILVSVQETIGC